MSGASHVRVVQPLTYAWLCLSSGLVGCSSERTGTLRSMDGPASASAPSAVQEPKQLGTEVDGDGQITAIVRRIFEDSRGHLWLGSNDEGVYRYDGSSLTWFTTDDGLAGYQITGILEDREGRIWLSTNGGVSRFDGRTFESFGQEDGLSSARVWSIYAAHDGTIWAGTAAGPCWFDGRAFAALELPPAPRGTPTLVSCIAQDRAGALWFGTDQGVLIHDGRSFRHLGVDEGLGGWVTCIVMDRNERVWLGSMTNGLCRYDGSSFTWFTAPADIGDNEVWSVHEDLQGNIWFDSEGYGVYRYDGEELRNFSSADGLEVLAVQSLLQDRAGRLWVGGAGGLYRSSGDTFVNVKRNGPWR